MPVSTLLWPLIVACTPSEPSGSTGSGPKETGIAVADSDDDSGTQSLPGTVEPVPDDQLRGIVTVDWTDRSHLLESLTYLDLTAQFWEEIDFGDGEEEVLIPYDGLDTCKAYTVSAGTGGSLVPGTAGVITVTLDESVFFHGPPNTDTAYNHTDWEPAWGAAVGVSAEGDGPIPPFDLPLVGWLAEGTPGRFTPEHNEVVPLEGLTITWDNPLGGELNLQLNLSWINYACVLADDGSWQVPAEYLALVDQTDGNAASATLHKGTTRYVPIADEQYVLFHVHTLTDWNFGFER